MRKLVLIYSTLLLGLLFDFIPYDTEAKDYFLFYDIRLTFQTYVYFIFEHAIKIVLCYIIAVEARKNQRELAIFFWLQVVDFLDYLLTYNTVWFSIGIIPVSMNVASVLFFGYLVASNVRDD